MISVANSGFGATNLLVAKEDRYVSEEAAGEIRATAGRAAARYSRADQHRRLFFGGATTCPKVRPNNAERVGTRPRGGKN